MLRLVQPAPEERYVGCVPLVPLKAAAGAFGEPQNVGGDGDWDWVAVDSASAAAARDVRRPGALGKSMEPAIPDGSYCLFSAPVTGGTREGRTVLVQLRDSVDPETGERYTVKRYESEKVASDDGHLAPLQDHAEADQPRLSSRSN